jgi:hypothetical protein
MDKGERSLIVAHERRCVYVEIEGFLRGCHSNTNP